AADPLTRTNPTPRWSVVRFNGLEPLSIAGLPACRACVRVVPPLLDSWPSNRFVPNARLLPLVPDNVKPVALPTALKFTFTVPPLWMSGEAPFVLPETIELTRLMAAVVPLDCAMPPPPRPPRDVLPVIVLLDTFNWPVTVLSAIPPPPSPAELPEIVELR